MRQHTSPHTQEDTLQTALRLIQRHRLIPVIRGQNADNALWGAEQLITAGFGIIEVTFTTPRAELVIETLADTYPDVLIGAGTVIEAKNAVQALGAGARFLAAPVSQELMIQFGVENNILVLPGVLTPTEMHQAMGWGASALKLFPAEPIGGPAYLRSILAPLPHLPVVATGGIHLENFTQYLRAGAMAVGLGGQLLPPDILARRDEATLQGLARLYLNKLAEYDTSPV